MVRRILAFPALEMSLRAQVTVFTPSGPSCVKWVIVCALVFEKID